MVNIHWLKLVRGLDFLVSGMVYPFTDQSYGHSVRCLQDLPTVSDIDGNTYSTIQIGTQIWMAENLKTTKYNDGTAIPLVTDDVAWQALSSPGFCWYNNDSATYDATYGALYNWFVLDTASNGNKNICPAGWHVPFDAEWTVLTNYHGGEGVAGGKLKEAGLDHWLDPNTDATNETGFTALPGGYRTPDRGFGGIKSDGSWWSSAEMYTNILYLYHDNSRVDRGGYEKSYGFSVRCLKDD